MSDSYKVCVLDERTYQEYECAWLGHSIYRCTRCNKGYFRFKPDAKYPEQCECCRMPIVITRRTKEWSPKL